MADASIDGSGDVAALVWEAPADLTERGSCCWPPGPTKRESAQCPGNACLVQAYEEHGWP
jgi:hypothetical protein